jgi:hypothetical protein
MLQGNAAVEQPAARPMTRSSASDSGAMSVSANRCGNDAGAQVGQRLRAPYAASARAMSIELLCFSPVAI